MPDTINKVVNIEEEHRKAKIETDISAHESNEK